MLKIGRRSWRRPCNENCSGYSGLQRVLRPIFFARVAPGYWQKPVQLFVLLNTGGAALSGIAREKKVSNNTFCC